MKNKLKYIKTFLTNKLNFLTNNLINILKAQKACIDRPYHYYVQNEVSSHNWSPSSSLHQLPLPLATNSGRRLSLVEQSAG